MADPPVPASRVTAEEAQAIVGGLCCGMRDDDGTARTVVERRLAMEVLALMHERDAASGFAVMVATYRDARAVHVAAQVEHEAAYEEADAAGLVEDMGGGAAYRALAPCPRLEASNARVSEARKAVERALDDLKGKVPT